VNVLDKIRWRIEKHIFDPLVSLYLNNRIYERDKDPEKNFLFKSKPNLQRVGSKSAFQNIITEFKLDMLYEKNFEVAYENGIKDDPNNKQLKEWLRYGVYLNAIVAKLAVLGGGDFCTVGVSYGVVPRTIYDYLSSLGLWDKQRKYILVDKWEGLLFASQITKTRQSEYCDNVEFIKRKFREDSFQIIQKYAPEALHQIKNKISYIHLNTTDAEAEFKTIEFIYDKLTTPGFIVIGHYGILQTRELIDLFLEKHNNYVIPLPNLQGIIVKI